MTRAKPSLPSDKKTTNYLLGLMKTLPAELFALVKELRDISMVIRARANTLNKDVQQVMVDLGKLANRLTALETIVHELCDVASTAMAIEPLWDVMKEE